MSRSLSRRSALAGASLLLASRTRAAETDVAIVGAGAAGLAAAKRLRALGRTCLVLEARDRIGGRVSTDRSLGTPFDAGAQYVHWADRNPWTRVAAELGVRTESDPGGGGFRLFVDGRLASDDEKARRRAAFGRLEAALTEPAASDRSVADASAAAGPDVLAAGTGLTRLSLGEEPDRVSAADNGQLWDGPDLSVPEGYGELVARFGRDVPVRLGAPVTRVSWGGRGVELDTPAGALRTRAAIVTVSAGVLQAGGIGFAPVLPSAISDAIGGLGMGAFTKVAIRFDRTRLDPSLLADALDLPNAEATINLEAWPMGRDLAIANVGGDFARQLCRAGERDAVGYVVERLAAVAGSGIRAAILGGVLADWWTDRFALGSYAIARPGRLSSREALRAPVGARIWFAGEATAGGGAMTAGGAYLEGERAAEEVSRVLGA